jgi:hypothetical protein
MITRDLRILTKQALFYWIVFSASVLAFTLLATALSVVGSSVGVAFFVSLVLSAGLLVGSYLYWFDVVGLASHWIPLLRVVLIDMIVRVIEKLGLLDQKQSYRFVPVHYTMTIVGVPELLPSEELIQKIGREKGVLGVLRRQDIKVIARRSLLQPESIIDFFVRVAVPIPILSNLLTGVALRTWEELVLPALAERYRTASVVRRTEKPERRQVDRRLPVESTTGEAAIALFILAEATSFLFSELGKRIRIWQAQKGDAVSSTIEVDWETGTLVLGGVRRDIRTDLLQARRSEIESLIATIREQKEKRNLYQKRLADPLVSPDDKVFLKSQLKLADERISEEGNRLATLLDQIFG